MTYVLMVLWVYGLLWGLGLVRAYFVEVTDSSSPISYSLLRPLWAAILTVVLFVTFGAVWL